MARFTVRVELHDADWDQYTELYENMAKEGFSDIIQTQKGAVKMPPAEYNYDGNLSKEQVLAKAKAAASQVVRSYAILVTESSGRTWHGLENA